MRVLRYDGGIYTLIGGLNGSRDQAKSLMQDTGISIQLFPTFDACMPNPCLVNWNLWNQARNHAISSYSKYI